MREVKTVEELRAMGGYFYAIGEEAWCDTPTASWKLEPGVGYVRQDDDAHKDDY